MHAYLERETTAELRWLKNLSQQFGQSIGDRTGNRNPIVMLRINVAIDSGSEDEHDHGCLLFSLSTRTDRRETFVVAKFVACGKRHRTDSA